MKPEFNVMFDTFWIDVYRWGVEFHGESIKKDIKLTWEELFKRLNEKV